MKKYKQIDLWISVVLITGFSITAIIKQDLTFITGYLIVGGWQVISMIIHAYQHWFTEKKGSRRIYHWITFISLITMPVGSFYILLFTAPFMAIYYTWLCYQEVYIKMQRPISLLK